MTRTESSPLAAMPLAGGMRKAMQTRHSQDAPGHEAASANSSLRRMSCGETTRVRMKQRGPTLVALSVPQARLGRYDFPITKSSFLRRPRRSPDEERAQTLRVRLPYVDQRVGEDRDDDLRVGEQQKQGPAAVDRAAVVGDAPALGVSSDPPADADRRAAADRHARREQLIERLLAQEPGLQVRRAEAHQVLGAAEESAAGPLVAAVDVWRVEQAALLVPGVEARAVGHDGADVVGPDAAQSQSIEDVLLHVREELLPRRPF